MGVPEQPVAEREQEEDLKNIDREHGGERGKEEEKLVNNYTDLDNHPQLQPPMLQRLNPTNPLRIVIDQPTITFPPPAPSSTTQQSAPQLNSTAYTDKISLFIFLIHIVVAVALVSFLFYKGIQGLTQGNTKIHREEKRLLRYFLPQAEAASVLSIALAFSWQKAVKLWPAFMAHFILWSTFFTTLATGIFLICFQKTSTVFVGLVFLSFSIGNALYACWISIRIKFFAKILEKSLKPAEKFPDLNFPIYWFLGIGILWISVWILAVIGAVNFYLPPLVIIGLVLSLMWTAEVMRNVANLTVSRVISLFYLRGMQISTKVSFARAMSNNLGSACVGSLFVPSIEALRIVARGLNLLEGEDEFMFFCAHCCLRVMQSIFRYGNGWAFVQIGTYGKNFVKASQDSWHKFERREMVPMIDSDITSALCFLTGVCSGATCTIMAATWTAIVHKAYITTISLLAFFVGYLMTRIGMALPQACVSCYYVWYAEDPEIRLFDGDETIPHKLDLIKSGRDVVGPTPRVPRRFR